MASRIVQCPVCGAQLYEPPGAPYFTCVCGTTLQSSSTPPPPHVHPPLPPQTNGNPPPQINGNPPPPTSTQSNSRPQSASTEPPDMSNLSLNGRPNSARPSSASSTGSQPPHSSSSLPQPPHSSFSPPHPTHPSFSAPQPPNPSFSPPHSTFSAPQPPHSSFSASQPQYHQCSTCGEFLYLPGNLPRDKHGNRLVRCGSCQSVNRFPDKEPESLGVAPSQAPGGGPNHAEFAPPQNQAPGSGHNSAEFAPAPNQAPGWGHDHAESAPPQNQAPGGGHNSAEFAPPSAPKQDELPPNRKMEFEPAPGRKLFAFEQQSQVAEAPKPTETASAAVSEQQPSYPHFGYDSSATGGYAPPPPFEPSTYPPGPPPPAKDQFASAQGFQPGFAPPPPNFHQSSLPAPRPMQYGGPQASLPWKFHEAGPSQPGTYLGGVGPPGVPVPPPVVPVPEKKKKKGFFGKFKRAFEDEDEFEMDVKVNGFPVPDAQVKKAEARAGELQPGDYWYDVRAGFWGVMDGPCLGIIPAGITELVRNKQSEEKGGSGVNELQQHFSGGTTGIIINGRELTPQDLKVLRGRGLSEERRAYWLDISGSLADAMTNQPLMQLGHLATSLAQGQQGLGMRIPKEELRRRNLEDLKKQLQEQDERRPIVARVSSG